MKYLLSLILLVFISCGTKPVVPSPVGATQPTWASAGGKDQYGTWADLQVAGVTQRFRWIVPGTFTMGSPQSEKDLAVQAGAKAEWVAPEVQHEVTISKGYWLADSECTQGLWQANTGSNPAKFQDSKNPVEQVSWDDCQGFLSKLNSQVTGVTFRLPSEAEWEYACRAGTKTPFSFGATITLDQVNYNGNYPYGGAAKGEYREKTVAVKSFQANAWGLYDMHGNVWEWCGDWYGDYPTGNVTDPTGPASGSTRVDRGGSWYNFAWSSRSAYRGWVTPDDRSCDLGFRLCAPVQGP
jgi:formylglycine-generating enzyme required for sulfatase activity